MTKKIIVVEGFESQRKTGNLQDYPMLLNQMSRILNKNGIRIIEMGHSLEPLINITVISNDGYVVLTTTPDTKYFTLTVLTSQPKIIEQLIEYLSPLIFKATEIEIGDYTEEFKISNTHHVKEPKSEEEKKEEVKPEEKKEEKKSKKTSKKKSSKKSSKEK